MRYLFRRLYTYFSYGSLRIESNFEKAVEDWHCSHPERHGCAEYAPLHEWLGLTWNQYKALVHKSSSK